MALPHPTALCLLLLALVPSGALAADTGGDAPAAAGRPVHLHVVAARTFVDDGEETWGLVASYEKAVSDVLAVEFGYFNEGHPDPSPHRDGFSLQLFAGVHPFADARPGGVAGFLADRLRLRAGAGPTIWFNSVNPDDDLAHEKTGVGVMVTGAVDFRVIGGLSVGPRVQEHYGFGSQNAVLVGLGVSYALFPAPERTAPDFSASAATGKSVRNALGGDGIPAWVAVRKNSLFGASNAGIGAAFLALDGPNDRRGVTVGPELHEELGRDGALAFDVGVAPYFYGDGDTSGRDAAADPSGVAAVIRTGASYRVWDRWRIVASFLREAGSKEQQNYDVFLGGVRYDFDLPGPRNAARAP